MSRQRILNGCYWLVVYAALWWLLAGNAGWGFGVMVIGAAVMVSVWLNTMPWRLRLRALPGFLGFFLWELCLGGWDVARRALHPRRPLNPAWMVYSLGCDDARVKLVLSAVVGLLPGTLSSRYEGHELFIHTLDKNQNWTTTVEKLERGLASLLGVSYIEASN